MHYDILNSAGSIYDVSEEYAKGVKRSFEVIFEEYENEVSFTYSNF